MEMSPDSLHGSTMMMTTTSSEKLAVDLCFSTAYAILYL